LYRIAVQSQVGQHGGKTLVEVRRAGHQPAVQRRGVDVSRIRIRGHLAGICQGRGRGIHGQGRRGAAGAPGDVAGNSLAGHPLVLLGQPPHERIGGCQADRALQWLDVTGQDSQQGALAGAVDAHDADYITRCNGEVQTLEEGPVGESAGHILRDKGCGHGAIVAPAIGFCLCTFAAYSFRQLS